MSMQDTKLKGDPSPAHINKIEKRFKGIFSYTPDFTTEQPTHLPKIIQAEKDKRDFHSAAKEQESRRRQNSQMVMLEEDSSAVGQQSIPLAIV